MKNVSPIFVGLLLVSSVNAFAVDDRGNTATQGPATWLRAAQYMLPKPQYVNGHLTLVPPHASHRPSLVNQQNGARIARAPSRVRWRLMVCDA